MPGEKKYTIRKILIVAVWIILGAGTVVLLAAAITRKNGEKIAGVDIHISGVQNNYFIDKEDVLSIIEKVNGKKLDKATVGSLDLSAMEQRLEKDQWVKKSEIFLDNNNMLQVKITEREPIARIFTSSGSSFYIDSSLMRLPLSDKFSARLPVFTNFPTEVKVLKSQDSVLLNGIKKMSEYILADPFWMAQIEQIDITPENNFEFIPKMGNQIIRFGDADSYNEKFNKLLAFYKQVQAKTGWNKYSVIDVQYKGQVVGIKRDAAEIKADSLRAIAIMRNIIEEAKKNTNDSTKIQLPQPEDNNKEKINNSPVLEEVPDETNNETNTQKIQTPESKPSAVTPSSNDPKKPIIKQQAPALSKSGQKLSPSSNEKPGPALLKNKAVAKPVDKPVKKVKEEPKRVPKAVMPSKSDY